MFFLVSVHVHNVWRGRGCACSVNIALTSERQGSSSIELSTQPLTVTVLNSD
jgi:hypothetical protein